MRLGPSPLARYEDRKGLCHENPSRVDVMQRNHLQLVMQARGNLLRPNQQPVRAIRYLRVRPMRQVLHR